jgi:hypothetical protein
VKRLPASQFGDLCQRLIINRDRHSLAVDVDRAGCTDHRYLRALREVLATNTTASTAPLPD